MKGFIMSDNNSTIEIAAYNLALSIAKSEHPLTKKSNMRKYWFTLYSESYQLIRSLQKEEK
jgi:hypothetical protein